MPSPVEIVLPVVEAAVALVPELLDIPVLGKILTTFLPAGGGDAKALEQLQKVADKKKVDRKTRIKNNARYVIKASEAMKCVENNLMGGKILLAFGKGLGNAIIGKDTGGAPDLIVEQIFDCIEKNELRQDTPRVIGTPKGKYVRPRKGHGKGRGKF